MAERKAVIKNADMSEDMQQDAVDCASQALEKYNIEKVCNIHSILTIIVYIYPWYIYHHHLKFFKQFMIPTM